MFAKKVLSLQSEMEPAVRESASNGLFWRLDEQDNDVENDRRTQ